LLIFNSYEYKELDFNEIDKYHRSYIQCLKDELVPVIPKQAIVNIIKQTNVSGKENSKQDF
jgi:hypothetical protein